MDDAGVSLQATMSAMGEAARAGARALRLASAEQRTAALQAMAKAIREDADKILAANAKDIEAAKANGLSGPMLDRLLLDEARLEGMAQGVETVAAIADPLGRRHLALDPAQRPGHRPGAHPDRRDRHDL
jgi:glutamate-5-semialdehyde dehydrogenase